MGRIRASWASVRPRTRRGAVLAAAVIVGGAAALSVALTVVVAMAWSPYVSFDLDRDSNPRAWAATQLSFAGSATCARCHGDQVQELRANPHAGVACESCHEALGGHVAEADASPSVELTALVEPESATCQRCHTAADGRPATMKTINPFQHYKPVCLECHDPHTSVAERPPVVLHPLDGLPPCITCHGAEGFKARNQRHPDAATNDAACLECHAKGRGPEDNR